MTGMKTKIEGIRINFLYIGIVGFRVMNLNRFIRVVVHFGSEFCESYPFSLVLGLLAWHTHEIYIEFGLEL